jgi:Na+-driven multidrug efflux pump
MFWDKSLFNSLIGFSGWSLIGNSSHILLTQGMNIIINIFFGVAVNAARAITVQVESAINNFVSNFMIALNPQITKNYAAGNLLEMKTLIQRGSKFSFFIFFFLSLPVFIETEIILKLWLKIVPQYTVIFIRLNLIVTLIYTLTNTYLTGIIATGSIKKYQLMIAIMVAVLFSVTYVLLLLGFSPEITYIIYIVIALFVLIFRIKAIKRLIGFLLIDFFNNVLFKAILVIVASTPLPIVLFFCNDQSLLRLIMVTTSSFVVTIISIIFLGLTKYEKEKISNYVYLTLKIHKKC